MSEQAPLTSAALARLLSRRVPPDKRLRTAMSCDFCKRKRCKCSRPPNSDEPCRACRESNQICRITEPRKRGRRLLLEPSLSSTNVSTSPRVQADSTTYTSTTRGRVFPPEAYKDTPTGFRSRNLIKELPVEALFEDLLGLPQYIGPTGSYTLLVSLRQMLSFRYSPNTCFPEAAQTMGLSTQYANEIAPLTIIDLPPREAADKLVHVFFTKVHRDFPVFHQAIFQASYESMWSPLASTEPAWLMALYLVFVLALETGRDDPAIPQKREAHVRYLAKAKALLPEVIAGCTLGHVQALMLYCLQTYISRERSACWNITGVSIRMAVAIGLHRNGANPKCSPLERELRKRVWWTLYAFERLECSSLGRPSAIDDAECNAPVPAEGYLDMGHIFPVGHLDAQSELLKLIGVICKNQYRLQDVSSEHVDFANGIIEQLESWRLGLPPHLRIGSDAPDLYFRSITVLHLQHLYAVTLCTRSLLAFKTQQRTETLEPSAEAMITTLAQKCTDAAASGIDLLHDLLSKSCLNSRTSWDIYFMESFSMILAIGKFAHEGDADPSYRNRLIAALETGMTVLKSCDGFSATMERFANVTADFSRTVVVAAKSDNGSPPDGAAAGGGASLDETIELSPPENSEGCYDFGSQGDGGDMQSLGIPSMGQISATQPTYEFLGLGSALCWEDFGAWALQQ